MEYSKQLENRREKDRRAYKGSLRCVNHPRNTKKGEKNETNKAWSIHPVTAYDSLMSVQQTKGHLRLINHTCRGLKKL